MINRLFGNDESAQERALEDLYRAILRELPHSIPVKSTTLSYTPENYALSKQLYDAAVAKLAAKKEIENNQRKIFMDIQYADPRVINRVFRTN